MKTTKYETEIVEKLGVYIDSFCPECENEHMLQIVRVIDHITLDGEAFHVDSFQFQCDVCNQAFSVPRMKIKDSLEIAYAEYKQRTGKEWHGIYRDEESA